MQRKTNYTNKMILITVYFVILALCFFLPLLLSFSVVGLILAEMLYLVVSAYLSFFYKKPPSFKEELNKLTFKLFSVLNISLVFITSLVIFNSSMKLISLFIGLPAFVAVTSLYSSTFISDLERVRKEALDYMSKVIVVISILFLVLSEHILFSSQIVEQLAVCVCFILISGVIGINYFYERGTNNNRSPLQKALLFSYSSILLLLVFVVISSLLIISLPVSLI